MRLYEKIIIGLVVLLFGLQILPDFSWKFLYLSVAILFLALSYLIGGYWLLNSKSNKRYFIPILAGLAFFTSLIVLPLVLRLRKETITEILPLLNIALFLGLSVYMLINKTKKKDILRSNQGILIRSAIFMTLIGFASYTPITFKPYRSILITMNSDIYYLLNNILMFDYLDEYQDALESGNCDQAIDYAEKANIAGKNWLGISPENEPEIVDDSSDYTADINNADDDFSEQSELWEISGTYSRLYKAYKCKAEKQYEEKNYLSALQYYLKANRAIEIGNQNSEYQDDAEAYSLYLAANCYRKLQNYKNADSLYSAAINKYWNIRDTNDSNVAIYFSGIADSKVEQLNLVAANWFYKASNEILLKDSNDEENRKNIIHNYNRLITIYLKNDSLEQARSCIEESFKILDKSTIEYCRTKLLYGFYFYKLSNFVQADKSFTESLGCSLNLLDPTHQNIAESYLALTFVELALADYDSAKSYLAKGMEIAIKNFGKDKAQYSNYIYTSANIDAKLGNYNKAEQKYYEVIGMWNTDQDVINQKLPTILSDLANLETELDKLASAKAHSDSAMTIITNNFGGKEYPSMTTIKNTAAYVEYCIGMLDKADSLYRKSLSVNLDFGLLSTVETANALNGLGLVMMAKKKYKKADSLFIESLNTSIEIFTENHPSTAIVYQNQALLKIVENKLQQAKELLNKSLNINRKFFKSSHIIFADIYVLFGDIAMKEKQPDTGNEYYQKALDIYLEKFDKNHIKVISVQEKLKSTNREIKIYS